MSLITLAEAASTNDYIKAHRAELKHGDAVTALRQTAGRGRMGHTWLGDDGMLPLSVLLCGVPYPQQITLTVSLAVCRAIEAELEAAGCDDFPPLTLKWVNDILIREKKICGILCESVCRYEESEKGEKSLVWDIICGVGVNLCQSEEFFAENGLPHGGSIFSVTGAMPDRKRLSEALCREITDYCMRDFSKLHESYTARCINIGRDVRLISPQGERLASAVGISPAGQLLCRDSGGEFSVSSGEVSVRGLNGYI